MTHPDITDGTPADWADVAPEATAAPCAPAPQWRVQHPDGRAWTGLTCMEACTVAMLATAQPAHQGLAAAINAPEPERLQHLMEAMHKALAAYVDGYAQRGHEALRTVIDDAIAGLLSDRDFVQAWGACQWEAWQAAKGSQIDVSHRSTERHIALREGHSIAAEQAYFEARPEEDTPALRRPFLQGFQRGFDAAEAAYPAAAWPLLERPASCGGATFSAGLSARLLVESAYRHADLHSEDKAKTAEQRKEDEANRRKLWDMLHGPLRSPAMAAMEPGASAAAAWVQRRLDNYLSTHGTLDPDTGAIEFGRGAADEAAQEYVGELMEIIDGIKGLASEDRSPACTI